MVTKKKQTEGETIAKAAAESAPKAAKSTAAKSTAAKPAVEVDWGKGFVQHHDAVVSGQSVKVPVPVRVRQALGQSQTKGRYDRIRLKVNGQEVKIGERRYYKASSEAQPSLTFEVVE